MGGPCLHSPALWQPLHGCRAAPGNERELPAGAPDVRKSPAARPAGEAAVLRREREVALARTAQATQELSEARQEQRSEVRAATAALPPRLPSPAGAPGSQAAARQLACPRPAAPSAGRWHLTRPRLPAPRPVPQVDRVRAQMEEVLRDRDAEIEEMAEQCTRLDYALKVRPGCWLALGRVRARGAGGSAGVPGVARASQPAVPRAILTRQPPSKHAQPTARRR